MKIEIGKRYLMANGLVATIMEYQPHKDHPWRGMFGDEYSGGSMSWNDEGYQCNRAAEYRLIEEAGTEFEAPEFLEGPVDLEKYGSGLKRVAKNAFDIGDVTGEADRPIDRDPLDLEHATDRAIEAHAMNLGNPIRMRGIEHTTPPDIVAITAISRVMRDIDGQDYSAVVAWFAARYPSAPF